MEVIELTSMLLRLLLILLLGVPEVQLVPDIGTEVENMQVTKEEGGRPSVAAVRAQLEQNDSSFAR